jgi:hypothetical protein
MDVELFPFEEGKKPTIVQPDVFIVCDNEKIKLRTKDLEIDFDEIKRMLRTKQWKL